MKKIGISTIYYSSDNYGGNLQAYALCRVLNDLGYDAEQVVKTERKNCFINSLKTVIKRRLVDIKVSLKDKNDYNVEMYLIRKSCRKFNLAIPHRFFDEKQINDGKMPYDAYIAGSDQVWNVELLYKPEYFLEYVPKGKKKISYSASIGLNKLDEDEKEYFKKALKDFSAISVREPVNIGLLKDLVPVTPVLTLDPTLLLTSEEWKKIASKRLIKEKYVYCYYLGSNLSARKCAEDYAKEHNCKVVISSRHDRTLKQEDSKFGTKYNYATPNDFLSLIEHSECVITDSFHAVVFSHLLKKEFFVFNRDENNSMNSRIYNICNLVQAEERFCDTKEKENINYLLSCKKLDYNKQFEKLEELKTFSINYLKENLD